MKRKPKKKKQNFKKSKLHERLDNEIDINYKNILNINKEKLDQILTQAAKDFIKK